MAFWVYLLLTILIEYPFIRKKSDQIRLANFWYSRILSAIELPWIVTIVWYLLPAIYGKAKSLLVDLVWALAVTYFSPLFMGYIEKDIEKVEFSLKTKYIVLLLLFVSAFLFVWFTFKLPWIDLFTNPENL